MLYYPQLTTGSVTQYPIARHNQRRTVINALADGTEIRTEDAAFAQMAWDLTYTQLTSTESAALETLFEASEGQLNTFTFLDPTDNLLNWTEDFTQNVWTSGPLLNPIGGVADPLGGTGAFQVTNTAQAPQAVSQTIAGPSWYQYCFSVWLRTDEPTTVSAVAASSGGNTEVELPVGSDWSRAVVPVLLANQQDGITFGVQVPAGNRIYLFGPQVEAQLGAGGYKKTTNLAGVYAHSRFASDTLALQATGPNQYGCKLRVMSCTAG